MVRKVVQDAGEASPLLSSAQQASLPLREKQSEGDDELKIDVQKLPDTHDYILSLAPPVAPADQSSHVPCDIVLVIDVSGSMECEARLPATGESTGLNILDLTKHAARTIITTLGDQDRVGLVTFASKVKLISPLVNMTKAQKEEMLKKIEALIPEDATNLWGGIKTGLGAFESAEAIPGNTRTLMVLTDGQPNHMCPPKGYVASLAPLLEKFNTTPGGPVSISTFGFSNYIRSELLQSIAEVSSGTFAFISGCEMIGTVFVHAIANLFSTYMSDSVIQIAVPRGHDISVAGGYRAQSQVDTSSGQTIISINLGRIIYGQSRNIMLNVASPKGVDLELAVRTKGRTKEGLKDQNINAALLSDSSLSDSEMRYHKFRHDLCSLLSSLAPWSTKSWGPSDLIPERQNLLPEALQTKQTELAELIDTMKSQNDQDNFNQSLLADLTGEIHMALSDEKFYRSWGQHYLLSLYNAHQKQMCNSFKDPGPLQYGLNSPLFVQSREELNDVFDNLPPPTPTVRPHYAHNLSRSSYHAPTSMRAYNRKDNPCFTGEGRVTMSDGSIQKVHDLYPGMLVKTLQEGSNEIVAIVKTTVRDPELCNINGMEITPWHPILLANPGILAAHAQGKSTDTWQFPHDMAAAEVKSGTVDLYSVMLKPSDSADSHCLFINDTWAVTLGHGVVDEKDDARSHAFLGDWATIWADLTHLKKDENGRHVSGGMARNLETGLVCSFMPEL